MSIFSAAEPTAPAVTGRDVLRAGLLSRKMGLAAVARELGLSADALESFAHGTRELPADKLNAIAGFIFGGHVEFDATTDLLRPTNRAEPQAFYTVRPPTFAEMKIDQSHLAPRVVPKPTTPFQPAKINRPGWE